MTKDEARDALVKACCHWVRSDQMIEDSSYAAEYCNKIWDLTERYRAAKNPVCGEPIAGANCNCTRVLGHPWPCVHVAGGSAGGGDDVTEAVKSHATNPPSVRIVEGLVAWDGEGPCPCNITIAFRRPDGTEEYVPLAEGAVDFTTDDVALLRRALGQDPYPPLTLTVGGSFTRSR